jgi:protein transport protein SEC24
MGIQESQRVVNLLTERQLIPPEGLETIKPVLPNDLKKVNCSPDIFRCTLNALPQTSALLNKARLPLGILIHPFRDLSQLPVIQSSVIVRCRSCRTYINPYVVFVDQRRWKCNLCYRVNDLPDEFSFDPVSKTYGDPQRRPEVKSATIEFIAPSEYMLRPPQPAVYLYLLDVSFNAVETGYLTHFSQILLDELDKLPGDARTSIGFLCYDSALYYFNLAEGLSQPQMLCVPDLEDPFLPCPDNLLVNLHESKELLIDLLNQLPNLFQGNLETGSALGAALQSAHKLMSPTGGRITVMQTCLPTVGPGALQNREAGNTPGKNTSSIGPATDFYKKLSLDCSAQQIAVDLFMLNGQYSDIATLSCISKYSAGSVYYYPSFHTVRNPGLVDKYDTDLRRYLTRKIGFESVMRIRCTRGLSIHTFHGNFFVRSTDLLSLPNINPDAGFGMQMSIEDNLVEASTVSFQAALLYTSSKGERRIRVHTLCVPVTNQLSEVFTGADQQAIISLLAKMAVDRSLNSALTDARDAMMNASLDSLMAFGQQIPASQRVGTLLAPYSLRLMPVFMLAMLKHIAFSMSGNLKIDDRVFAMQQCKVMPVCYLLQSLYPHLYPLHKLNDEKPIKYGKEEIPSAPLLQLSSANIDRTGLFLMDTAEAMYLLVGSGIGDQMCQDIFGKPNFMSIPDDMMDLPELDNPTSERIRSFVNYLIDLRPHGVSFLVIRDDSKNRLLFFQHMLEDKTENSMSYFEFLQFLQGKAKG